MVRLNGVPFITSFNFCLGYGILKDSQILSTNNKWDLLWSDTNEFLKQPLRLNEFQKVNHFPCMQDITRKDFLANNLYVFSFIMSLHWDISPNRNALQKLLPKLYDFYPKSFNLPNEYRDLKCEMSTSRKTYIVKVGSLTMRQIKPQLIH